MRSKSKFGVKLKNPSFTFRQCFGRLSRALRANGGSVETIGFYPFVVSLSNHSEYFFNSLLKGSNVMTRLSLTLVAVIAIVVLIFPVPALGAEVVKVGGTGSALATMRAIADIFEKENPGIKVEVLPSLGSTGGIKAVLKGALDVAVSGRELDDSEKKEWAEQVEYAKSPFVFVTNKNNISTLTLKEIIQIYDGSKTTWPDQKRIRLVLRPEKDASSMILGGISPEMRDAVPKAHRRPGMIVAITDQECAETLQNTPDSFGTLTLDQMISEKLTLNVLSLDNIKPSVKALARGTYKIYKPYYIVTTNATSPHAKRFISYIGTARGIRILEKNGYLVTQR